MNITYPNPIFSCQKDITCSENILDPDPLPDTSNYPGPLQNGYIHIMYPQFGYTHLSSPACRLFLYALYGAREKR